MRSAADLRQAFHEAVDDYLETCAPAGATPAQSRSRANISAWSPLS